MQALPSLGAIIDETYEIKSLLGKGGFGAVYLARHIPMEREVALKLLLPQGHNPMEMVQRFRREVMAIRNLSHPNTVRIFDYRDSDEDTLIYYTMEYLRGETLKDVVRGEGPQSPRRVSHIIKQILKSLAEAHAMGIVHRDLKPANIMLVEMYGEQDFVKVLDFGIAKVMEQEDDEDEPLTSAGMLVGTLRYMSPEQIKGLPLGPYTDIYALGLITLEMLIGQSVFAGTGRWEILQKQVSPQPIEFPAELYNSPLRPILERMLAKESAERYPNAEELLRDLNSIPPGALSHHPLVSNRANLPPLPGHNSASNISHSAPSTPHPSSIDEMPTAISDLNAIAPERVPVDAAGQPMSPGVGAPTIPMPSITPPTPAGQDLTPAQEAAHTSDDSFIVLAKPPSRTPMYIGVGVAALLLIGGGAFAVSSMSASDETTRTAPSTLAAKSTTDTKPESDPESNTEVAQEVEDEPAPPPAQDSPPAEEKPEPHKVTVTLDKVDARATAYLDDKEIGTLPLTHEIPTDTTHTLTIKAKGYESTTVDLDKDSPDTLPVTLKKVQVKERRPSSTTKPEKKPEKKTEKKPAAKVPDDDWADIPGSKKRTEKKTKEKGPFIPEF